MICKTDGNIRVNQRTGKITFIDTENKSFLCGSDKEQDEYVPLYFDLSTLFSFVMPDSLNFSKEAKACLNQKKADLESKKVKKEVKEISLPFLWEKYSKIIGIDFEKIVEYLDLLYEKKCIERYKEYVSLGRQKIALVNQRIEIIDSRESNLTEKLNLIKEAKSENSEISSNFGYVLRKELTNIKSYSETIAILRELLSDCLVSNKKSCVGYEKRIINLNKKYGLETFSLIKITEAKLNYARLSGLVSIYTQQISHFNESKNQLAQQKEELFNKIQEIKKLEDEKKGASEREDQKILELERQLSDHNQKIDQGTKKCNRISELDKRSGEIAQKAKMYARKKRKTSQLINQAIHTLSESLSSRQRNKKKNIYNYYYTCFATLSSILFIASIYLLLGK